MCVSGPVGLGVRPYLVEFVRSYKCRFPSLYIFGHYALDSQAPFRPALDTLDKMDHFGKETRFKVRPVPAAGYIPENSGNAESGSLFGSFLEHAVEGPYAVSDLDHFTRRQLDLPLVSVKDMVRIFYKQLFPCIVQSAAFPDEIEPSGGLTSEYFLVIQFFWLTAGQNQLLAAYNKPVSENLYTFFV